jgi:plastocyanin
MTRRLHRRALAALLAVGAGAFVLGGCGGGGGGSGVTKTATNGTIDVTALDIKYDVKTIDAKPGKLTVNLTEGGSLDHTFTVKGHNLDLKVSSGTTHASGSVDLPAGTYTFYCKTPGHEAAGMHGTIVVAG